MSIKHFKCGSASTGPLATGCEHCIKGSKMVLFITGKCNTGCFYCPVSLEKKNKDVIYANEMKISNKEDILEEADAMEATGTGITGGDPLLNVERTVTAIKLLKEHFGKEHHIHLYTSTLDPNKIKMVRDAGLDEIRFHPPLKMWKDLFQTPLKEIAAINGIDVGMEVPALPDHEEDLDALITYAFSVGVKFINLNELEFSESNWDMMKSHEYEILGETSSAVRGSKDLAMKMMKKHPEVPIHFCASSFKDGVQLRNRFIRRAKHVAKEYDIVTKDGTILKGIVYADNLDTVISILKEKYDVPDELIFKDTKKNRLEVASWVLEELANELPFKCYITEEYPTSDRLEVERMPLN